MSEQNSNNGTPIKKANWLHLHEATHENDIKFRGPLSYGGFQILGWLCIVLSSVVVMMKMGSSASTELAPKFTKWIEILENIVPMSLPFLLLVNFAKILNNEESYKKQLIRNAIAVVGIYVGFWLFYSHFILGSVAVFATKPEDTEQVMDILIQNLAPNGFFAFNIFVDMFLCTALMFFLNYRPQKVFTGKAVIIFRLFAILPILYELGCMYLKASVGLGEMKLPVFLFPLLTVKPVMTFTEFIVMAIFIKVREIRYCRKGRRTYEEYQEFLKTNRNSLHFAVFTAISMLLLGLLDYYITTNLINESYNYLVAANPENMKLQDRIINFYLEVGLGKGSYMAFVAPVVLLFSYTRQPKFKKFLIFIPVAGIALILFIILQGSYQILHVVKVPKIDMMQTINDITKYIQEMPQ